MVCLLSSHLYDFPRFLNHCIPLEDVNNSAFFVIHYKHFKKASYMHALSWLVPGL